MRCLVCRVFSQFLVDISAISLGRSVLKARADAVAAEFSQLAVAYSLLSDDLVPLVFPSAKRHPDHGENRVQVVSVLDTSSAERVTVVSKRVRDTMLTLLHQRNTSVSATASISELAEALKQTSLSRK